MIDDFARLRGDIYLDHGPDHPEGSERLARALSGIPDSDPLDPVLDALCRFQVPPGSSPILFEQSGIPENLKLGTSAYVDRLLADFVRAGYPPHRITAGNDGSPAALLRFALSTGDCPLPSGFVRNVLDTDSPAEVLVDACAYAGSAGLKELEGNLQRLAKDNFPWGVRLEAAIALDELGYPAPPDLKSLVITLRGGGSGASGEPVESFRADAGPPVDSHSPYIGSGGPQLAQTVFYGDPMRPGKGGSGGIGTLVREVGGALAADGLPVITVACYDTARCGYPLIVHQWIGPGHLLIRLPVFLTERSPSGFLQAEHRIARAAGRALSSLPAAPGAVGVVHVRFLDDATRAVARVARSRGLPLAVTLTADPHRTVCHGDGRIVSRGIDSVRELMNRILIGDQVLDWSAGVVAIGRMSFSRELVHYFPQLENSGDRVLSAIDEGVNCDDPPLLDGGALLCDPRNAMPLAASELVRPFLITVGRLSPVKGQVNLVRAWAESDLHRYYGLVVVGGDLEAPSPEEQKIIQAIREHNQGPLKGRLCHLGAQENSVIRSLLAWSAARRKEGAPDIYVCPSLKEEFGLSILEAMAAGLPVVAPLRGGPPTYIRHGINGFLFDTHDMATIRDELNRILIIKPPGIEQLMDVKRRARETILEQYSLRVMAGKYRKFYGTVMDSCGNKNTG